MLQENSAHIAAIARIKYSTGWWVCAYFRVAFYYLYEARNRFVTRKERGGDHRFSLSAHLISICRFFEFQQVYPIHRESNKFSKKNVLVLQGGGALAANQAGVYVALHEAGYEPEWVAGISIGSINAALIAGNAIDKHVE